MQLKKILQVTTTTIVIKSYFKNLKNISYLFVALGLFLFVSCETSESNKVDEPMVCHNEGEVCLSDHSCCIINQEVEGQDSE